MLRGASPVPENFRYASAKPEVVEGAAGYFRNEVVQDIHPHLKDEATERLLALIRGDYTIPEVRRESLLTLSQEDDYGLFLSETFIYAMNRPINPNPDDGCAGYGTESSFYDSHPCQSGSPGITGAIPAVPSLS